MKDLELRQRPLNPSELRIRRAGRRRGGGTGDRASVLRNDVELNRVREETDNELNQIYEETDGVNLIRETVKIYTGGGKRRNSRVRGSTGRLLDRATACGGPHRSGSRTRKENWKDPRRNTAGTLVNHTEVKDQEIEGNRLRRRKKK